MTQEELSTPYGYCQCNCGGKTKIALRSNAVYGHTKGEPVRYILGHSGRGRKHPPEAAEKRLAAPTRQDIDPVWLRREYEERLRSTSDIGREIGARGSSVARWLRFHDIPVRSKSRGARLAKSGCDFNDAEAARLYHSGIGGNDIARRLNASPKTVYASLKRQGVKLRSRSEAASRRDTGMRKWPSTKQVRDLSNRCAFCGTGERLEIHHIDGCRDNNESGNLTQVCWEHHMMLEFFVRNALMGIRAREVEVFASLPV